MSNGTVQFVPEVSGDSTSTDKALKMSIKPTTSVVYWFKVAAGLEIKIIVDLDGCWSRYR